MTWVLDFFFREHYGSSGSNVDNITDHRILFDRNSYITKIPSQSVFSLPSYCNSNCTFGASAMVGAWALRNIF